MLEIISRNGYSGRKAVIMKKFEIGKRYCLAHKWDTCRMYIPRKRTKCFVTFDEYIYDTKEKKVIAFLRDNVKKKIGYDSTWDCETVDFGMYLYSIPSPID